MFVGDAVFPGEVLWGTRCPIFAGDPDAITHKLSHQVVYMLCITYTQILKVVYHVCSEMYH